MAGKPQAPSLKYEEAKQRWRLRFTHEKERHDRSNASIPKEDKASASRWAATVVADVVAGRDKPKQGSDPHAKLSEVGAAFVLERTGGMVSDETSDMYKSHLRAHLVPAFPRLSDCTDATIASYQARRLKQVRYSTIKKEFSTLRQVLGFAKLHKWISELPKFPAKPGKAKGTRHKQGSVGHTRGVTAEHIQQIIPLLPEFSRASRIDGIRWPIRGLFEITYESGLRVGFWDRFRVGTHWLKGWDHLEITEESDKGRWQRRVPLTARAVEILESLPVQADGQVFSNRRYRAQLEKAALKVLPPELATRLHVHDLRHVRTTELMETGDTLGVGYLVGHTQVSTTSKYSHADEAAAKRVLAKIAQASDSGDQSGGEDFPPDGSECSPLPESAETGSVHEGRVELPRLSTPEPKGGFQNVGPWFSAVWYRTDGRQTPAKPTHSGDSPQNDLTVPDEDLSWSCARAEAIGFGGAPVFIGRPVQ